MPRIALGVQYDGANCHGWQRQRHAPSVQQILEETLSSIVQEEVKTVCAGRTDTGVHAACQVVHFDTRIQRPLRAWTLGVNARLPDTISVLWAKEVDASFHARFSALWREYRYVIVNSPTRHALLHKRATWVRQPLDCEAMHRAAQYFLGEQDFSAFRSSQCQSQTPYRCVMRTAVRRIGSMVVFSVRANAFLHHMVRNMVGSLIAVGKHDEDEVWILDLLRKGDRTLAAPTAPPDGLYLTGVRYPAQFSIPSVIVDGWPWTMPSRSEW
ncbi:MAG: tRNA pseudouridine(38-40) synthase TruA [Gammaproteobacteria bacterium]|nr:MAG: tRNA pseudouridine(38-40) synthase TruA [Gammaproteobacteria bacterium]